MIADLTKSVNELCENDVETYDPRAIKVFESMQKDIIDNYISLIEPISEKLGELYMIACLFEDEQWFKDVLSGAVDAFVSRAQLSISIASSFQI